MSCKRQKLIFCVNLSCAMQALWQMNYWYRKEYMYNMLEVTKVGGSRGILHQAEPQTWPFVKNSLVTYFFLQVILKRFLSCTLQLQNSDRVQFCTHCWKDFNHVIMVIGNWQKCTFPWRFDKFGAGWQENKIQVQKKESMSRFRPPVHVPSNLIRPELKSDWTNYFLSTRQMRDTISDCMHMDVCYMCMHMSALSEQLAQTRCIRFVSFW